METNPQDSAPKFFSLTKRRLAGLFFVIWGGAAIGLVAVLGRAGCETALGGGDAVVARPAVAAGWQMRQWLPADPVLAGVIAGQLAKRGPLPGVQEEIFIAGRAGLMGERLRRAGWKVSRAAPGEEPRVEIFSPGRVLEWSGRFRAEDFLSEETVVLDTVLLGKVARGEAVMPFVPVGCATPLDGTGRMAGPAEVRRFLRL
jgi:hypothetical protein